MAPLILILASLLVALLLCYTFPFSSFLFSFSFSKKSGRGPPLPPGPIGWPILGNLLQLGTKPHHTLAAMAKTYGPLFRLRLGSVEAVVASSAAVAEEFLRTHDGNFCNRPPNAGAEHIAYNYQDLVFAPYGPRLRSLRKLCAVHLFSQKALDALRPIRESEVHRLVSHLRSLAPQKINLGAALNACATDALGRATVGKRVFGDEAAVEEFKGMVVELMRLAGVFNIGDFVKGLAWLDLQGVVGKMKRLHQRYDVFLDRIIEEHRAAGGEGGGDLLSVLIGLKENVGGEGVKLTDTEIKALFLNLFTAGTDTTSSTVEWALAELIRHPDILKQAQLEIDLIVGRARPVSDSDLANLPLVTAIVKETFRLHPSTPLSLPRVASEACEVGGYRVPKNATLLVNVWAIGRDPASWSDPLEFHPARFLPGGDHEGADVRGNDFDVIPFGAGRRICAGMSLGLRMVQLMTAALIHAFDWTLPDGQVVEKLDMEEAYGLTLQRAVPLELRPIPRLAQQIYVNDC